METFLQLIQTWPGIFISVGVAVGMLVFLAPIFMESPSNTRAANKIIFLTDWGFSIAATLIGVGLLWGKIEYPTLGAGLGKSRFVIPGFFFAFAGFKTFGGAHNWTMFRP